MTTSIEVSGATSDAQLESLWLADRPETTRAGYARELRWWRAAGLPALGLVRLLDVRAVLDGAPPCAPATLARRVAALRSLLSFGHRLGYLPINVGAVLRPVRLLDALGERILEPDQVVALLAAAALAPRQGRRDHALVRFLYSSGARVSEACGLTWERVHYRDGGGASVTLIGKGAKVRAVWVSDGTARELRELPHGGPFVFSRGARPLAQRDAQRIIERSARRAGLAAKVSPHWLRHAHATHALERGAPVHVVAADLGHASVATTTRYLHARPDTGSAHWLLV